MDYELLRSQVEEAFGHQNDEDGLSEFLQQLEFYPELAPQILEALSGLATSGDAKLCHELAADYAHRALEPQQAVQWVRDLHAKVAAQVAC